MKTTCIMCPLGCELEIKKLKNGELKVSGNSCVRGEKYAVDEVVCPQRSISTLMRVGTDKVVAVKTTKPIPKNKIDECLKVISNTVLVEAPPMGSVVIKNILDLDVDVVSIHI